MHREHRDEEEPHHSRDEEEEMTRGRGRMRREG